jgi:hypothetical protein
MITAEQIPDEVVEAAAKAAYLKSIEANAGSVNDWDDPAAKAEKQELLGVIRAALAAALNAWETPMHRAIVGKALDEVGSMYSALILPLPKEGSEEPQKKIDGAKYWDDPDTYGYS